ncbi:hypothetical protein H072_2333 [Dactylellina haptotyla CBS 200.50]|uniref:Uncharacterized protein n=1 Tax=Dactylellina haptotyla (strain CBS 200.50) TaxID=1284197 RepID=S8BVY9_DACHA|nr:hypothetical protein H072_2333 [Dactylellina haptotyla CBS 200.50]
MKVNSQLLALLLLVASTSASYAPIGGEAAGVESAWGLHAREVQDWRLAMGLAARAVDPKAGTPSAKEIFIAISEKKKITPEVRKFLDSVPDVTYEKLLENSRKIHQAVNKLWDGEKPDLSKLQTSGKVDKPVNLPSGPLPSRKERFIFWAESRGIAKDKINAVKKLDDSEFDKLRDMSMKDRIIKEAQMVGATGKIDFFKSVDQKFYDDLDKLNKQVREARKQLRAGQKPTSLGKRAESAKDIYIKLRERKGADAKEITYLRDVEDSVFDQMKKMNKQYGQALGKIWRGEVPELSKLPSNSLGSKIKSKVLPQAPEGATTKEKFLFWAKLRNVKDDKLKKVKEMSQEEFTKIRHLPTKEMLLKEAELIEADKKTVEFIKNKVPQSVYEEMDKIKTKERDARKQLQDGKKPSL